MQANLRDFSESSLREDGTTYVVSSKLPLINVNFRELWQYRDLIRLFVYRDYIAYFQQTILGPLWWIFQPVVSSLAFVLVFSIIARVSTDSLPPSLFYLAGLTIWAYFSNTMLNCAEVFNANAHVFGKIYFPKLAVPIALAITNFIKLLFQLGFFVFCYVVYLCLGWHIIPHWSIVFLPLLILYVGLFAVGTGLILASITCKFRDVALVLPFIVQMWMFMSAIVIPMSAVPERVIPYLRYNPMVEVVELFRYMTMSNGSFHWNGIAYGLVCLVIVFFVGLICFSKSERVSMDTI